MTGRILWGVLADAAGLQAVLGRLPACRAMVLPEYALRLDGVTATRILVPAPGQVAAVAAVQDLTEDETARLDFVATALGAGETGGFQGLSFHFAPEAFEEDGTEPPGLALALVRAILRNLGQAPAEALARRRGPMAVAAASALRAQESPPATRRHAAGPGDHAVARLRHPYGGFFAVEERDMAWRRFDGTMSPTVPRAVFVVGDAVTVLPYDPRRDRVLLIEQFRAGPQARGDAQPWSLEAVAGRIDPGETPEEAARREAVEEAGLTLAELHFVARYYPSPGAVAEYLYSYVALTDLPDGSAGIFGREDEAEDIRGHLVDFDALMALVASGEVENAPLILTALWLQRERPGLRRPA